jgi:hypothetical protein
MSDVFELIVAFVYLMTATFLTGFAIAPFGARAFVGHADVRYTLSDFVILSLELGMAGSLIFKYQVFPDLELNIALLIISWILLTGLWIAGTILIGRAGIQSPARRAVVLLFIVPATLCSTFGLGGFYLHSWRQGWDVNWNHLLFAIPTFLFSAFLARCVVKHEK